MLQKGDKYERSKIHEFVTPLFLTNSVAFAGAFNTLHLLLNEYLLHEIERMVCEDSMKELMVNMVSAQASELSDASFIEWLGPDFLSSSATLHSPAPPLGRARGCTVQADKLQPDSDRNGPLDAHSLHETFRRDDTSSGEAPVTSAKETPPPPPSPPRTEVKLETRSAANQEK